MQTRSLDTSTRLLAGETESDQTKPDAPPRGSTLLVETALAYARKIGIAETLEEAREYARVIIDQLDEIKAKIERQRAVTKG